MKKKLIIAIDGPAGSGKSTTARLLAKKLKLPYIDTGAMYRAVTLWAMKKKLSWANVKALRDTCRLARIRLAGDPMKQRVHLNGRDVTKAVRDPELTKNVVYVAREGAVREEMVKKQRRMAKKYGAVMEGRDIGTVVFPRADFKFFFEADEQIRAKRRYRELIKAGKRVSLREVLKDQRKRDLSDQTRKEGPLKRAKDARVVNTSSLTIEETVDIILPIVLTGSKSGIPGARGRR